MFVATFRRRWSLNLSYKNSHQLGDARDGLGNYGNLSPPVINGRFERKKERWNKLEKRERGREIEKESEKKKPGRWSAARCLCGLYISAFRKQAKRGRGTHTHQKALGPFQTAGTRLRHLHADMKAARLGTQAHQYFSASNDAAPVYESTRRKHVRGRAAGTFTRRPGQFPNWTETRCSVFLDFFLVWVGFMCAVPIVNSARPKVTPLLSETDFVLLSLRG